MNTLGRLVLTATFALALVACNGATAQERIRVLVAYTGNLSGIIADIEARGGQVVQRLPLVNALSVEMPSKAAIAATWALAGVETIEPEVDHRIDSAELNRSKGVLEIGAGSAHERGIMGAGVKAGAIDTGIDYTISELAANYAGGLDTRNGDNDPFDDNNHGTHIFGILAAILNGVDVVGVAPQARLYACKAFSKEGSGTTGDILACLQWLADQGVQVINHSYGASSHTGTIAERMYDTTAAMGIIHVASAGNRGSGADTVGWPAQFGSVIGVAATNRDRRAGFSSTGPAVELSAPGVTIRSTTVGGALRALSGTSMSAPHVTGTVALAISEGQTDIRTRLAETAKDLGPAGWDPEYGHGRVDVVAMLDNPDAPTDPVDPIEVHIGDLEVVATRHNAKVTVTVLDSDGFEVHGARVVGEWLPGCRTDGGACTFESRLSALRTAVRAFTVIDIVGPGFIYRPDLNVDADGDSDGTTIMIPGK